ncbi:phosphoribosyltransferase [Rubellimicrobium roseum]|uniref:Phosphoribosyltransferase n=1 Tax=Rubellimicrobium roseum TaxID=687525 RepID=A0A5C4NMK5_9RHOB|nr:phosphoribosyltransferase [Rubellimicrobium roseum]TNC74356.1 phosphoribosyltransferase [Rubellimicrobium roseum]
MTFRRLDDGVGLRGAFTLAYKITDDRSDRWTRRFIRFKDKDNAALSGAAETCAVAFPELITALDLDPKTTIIVPAISSREVAATPDSYVSRLAKVAADAAGLRFTTEAIRKQPHQPIHKIYNAADRSAALDAASYVAAPIDARIVFVVDDFITRGGTMSRIAQALIHANPGIQVGGVALGKTARRAYWGDLTNDHVPQRWDSLWQSGEPQDHAWLAKGRI